jgi:hypothetical protein
VVSVGELDAVDEEDAAADAVVAPGVALVTVVAQTEATTFRLLRLRQALHRIAAGWNSGRGSLRRWRQREAWRWRWQ